MKTIEDSVSALLTTIIVFWCLVAFRPLGVSCESPLCGVRQTSNDSVVAGEQIEPGEWPWHVAIYWWRGSKLNPPDRICEGSLVDSEGWVLTAASCLRGSDGSLFGKKGMMVHVGLVALQQNTRGSRKFRVDRVVMKDEVDLALVKVQVPMNSDWSGVTVCLGDEDRDWDKSYGKLVYVLQQSHRHRLGGFEIVKLQLDEETVCNGLTLSKAISDNTIQVRSKDSNYRVTSRGTPLYLKDPQGWTLLGIANKAVQSSGITPGALCQPGDYESFLNVNVDSVQRWIAEQLNDIDIGSGETE